MAGTAWLATTGFSPRKRPVARIDTGNVSSLCRSKALISEMVCYAIFAAVLFLIILNGYLRGRWKRYTDIVLGLALCATVLYAAYSKGWIVLVYLTVIWLIGGNLILTPLAKVAARKLLS